MCWNWYTLSTLLKTEDLKIRFLILFSVCDTVTTDHPKRWKELWYSCLKNFPRIFSNTPLRLIHHPIINFYSFPKMPQLLIHANKSLRIFERFPVYSVYYTDVLSLTRKREQNVFYYIDNGKIMGGKTYSLILFYSWKNKVSWQNYHIRKE